ncbi:MAG: phosphate propanoyltransferase [Clostridiaceae bacterium]|nr:phosphate propanoyltransferase [Clostridiaceae bacterium]
MEIMIETSARHLHVTQEDLETLFGKGYELHPKKWLSQPGQFLSEEKVQVKGSRSAFPGVSILGPVRPATQVEITLTDCRAIGVTAPVRESGNIEGSAGCELIGPCGSVTIDKGVIVAKRHIHMTPEEAKELGLENGQIVSVKTNGSRPVVFGDTVVRVSPKFAKAMHIDVDEANAAGLTAADKGEIIK